MSLMRTYSESVLVKGAFAPAAFTNGTQNGTSIDTLGLSGGPYRRAALVANLNQGAATTANIQVQESANNSTWTNITGATLAAAVVASTPQVQVVNIDMAKRKRYLRVQVIGTGTAGSASAEFHFFTGSIAAPVQDAAALTV